MRSSGCACRSMSACPRRLQRIGLSATQRPIDKIAEFLVGVPDDRSSSAMPIIIDIGHQRQLDLGIETPSSDLGAVCMHEQCLKFHCLLIFHRAPYPVLMMLQMRAELFHLVQVISTLHRQLRGGQQFLKESVQSRLHFRVMIGVQTWHHRRVCLCNSHHWG